MATFVLLAEVSAPVCVVCLAHSWHTNIMIMGGVVGGVVGVQEDKWGN